MQNLLTIYINIFSLSFLIQFLYQPFRVGSVASKNGQRFGVGKTKSQLQFLLLKIMVYVTTQNAAFDLTHVCTSKKQGITLVVHAIDGIHFDWFAIY